MSVTAVRTLAEIAERIGRGDDPKEAILASIDPQFLADYEVFHNQVLIATYIRSDKSKGGIYLGGDRTRAEDRFQGSVGLVLKVGPGAFKDDRVNQFFGVSVKEGDWIHFRTSDAREFFFVDPRTRLDGTSVRLIEDVHVKGRIQDPESVF